MTGRMGMNEQVLTAIKRRLPEEELLLKLSDFFAILGDSTRMQIISLLRIEQMNVTDIARALSMSISAVSHQLRILRANDLVRTERRGKYIYYHLSDEHVEAIFDMGVSHLTERRRIDQGGNHEEDL